MVFRERPELRLWIYKWPCAAVINFVAGVLLSIQWPTLFVTANRAVLTRFGTAAILSAGMVAVVFFVMASLFVTADDFSLATGARKHTVNFSGNPVSIEQERPVGVADPGLIP